MNLTRIMIDKTDIRKAVHKKSYKNIGVINIHNKINK